MGKREIQNVQFEEKRNTGKAKLELCPVFEEIKTLTEKKLPWAMPEEQ